MHKRWWNVWCVHMVLENNGSQLYTAYWSHDYSMSVLACSEMHTHFSDVRIEPLDSKGCDLTDTVES